MDGGDAGPSRQRHGHGASLTQEALALLPTPKATNNENQQRLEQYGPNLGMVLMPDQYEWTGAATPPPSPDGYAPAIARWERLTRPAPAPTIPGTNGRPRLSPRFVEWMMGLPEGHVTGHGLRPAQALKMLGNGVVPAQAALALRLLLAAARGGDAWAC